VATIAAAGGSTIFLVSASPSGCSGGSWSATVSDSTWMNVSSPSGTTAASVTANYLANTGTSSRSGTVTIAGQSITINQAGTITPPVVAPSALPSGVVGQAYSANLSASGGTPPYGGWVVSSGSLPPGLNLNASSGAISGTPSTAIGSPFIFSVTVKDSLGVASAPQSLSIAIATITTSSIPSGIANVVYPATTFGVTGATAPYQWSLSSGTLSGSMSFSTGGVLSGTPSGIGSFPFTITVTGSSTPPLTLSENFTLTVAPPPVTLLSISSQQLNLSYVQGDSNLPSSQNIGVLSNPSGTGITANSTTSDGGTWLSASTNFPGGKTPGTITVSVDPSKLGPNTYSGQVNISAPNASPSSVTVYVTLQVSASQVPQLAVTPPVVSFALPQGGQSQGSVVVSNTGGGTLSYSVAASSDANWLALNGSSVGIITPSTPSSLAFTVNAGAGIAPGLHSGAITVTDLGSGKSQISNVALLVNGSQPTMQLSQSGLTVYAVANTTVAPPAQSFAIFNLGAGTFSWTTQIQYAAAGQSWLTVTPNGSSTSTTPGEATVTVNPAGLAKGQYYATVNVQSATAVNSPQSFTVLLNVVGAGELGSGPQVSTSGMILAAAAGSTAATQSITLYSPAGASLNYSTSMFTSDGGNWLSVTAPTGSLGAAGTASLTIQASAAGVTAGVYYGTVQVAFSEGTIQTIQVALVATPGANANPMLSLNVGEHPAASAACTPKTLAATFSKPGENAQLQVGQAQTFQVQIVDNCNAPLLPSQSATAQLRSNAVLLATLSSDNDNGVWTGSWTPSSPQADVPVRVFASRGQAFGGISTPANSVVDVVVLPANTNSAAQPLGAVNGASFDTSNPGLVVPGGYVSIFGARMADNAAQGGAPLPFTLGGAQLLLAGQPLPLLFVNASQVNGVIPQSEPLYTNIQLVVQRGNSVSVPVSAYVTDLQPGIFTVAQNGQGQGAILINGTALVAGPSGVGQQPVSRGQYIQIYATGLGAVVGPGGAAPPADGQLAPVSPLFNTVATATVTIGGVNAPVPFAGLAPGFVWLYQVNAQVPSNAPVGSAIPVVLTMTDSNGFSASSQQNVTIAVQ